MSDKPGRLPSPNPRPVGNRRTAVPLLLAAAAVVLTAACGPQRAPEPGASAQAPVDRSNIIALDQKVAAALLPAPRLPGGTTSRESTADFVGHHLQQACAARLPTDDRIVTDAAATWGSADDLPFLDQWVAAYDRPVGAQAVDEARTALTCTTYPSRHGTVEVAGAFEVAASAPGTRAFGFCEELDGSSRTVGRCSIIAGGGDVACNLRAWAATTAVAKRLALSLAPELVRRCGGQDG